MMKRYYAATMLLTTLLLLPGCFKQDYSDCTTPDNLILKLDLKNDNGSSRFAQEINSIFAVVYDDANRYVAHAEVAKNELNRFPGVSFHVQPGEYRVVCWGNIGEYTAVRGIDSRLGFEACHLETISNATGCPLYYAPRKEASDRPSNITRSDGEEDIDYSIYTVEVPANTITTHEVDFGRAHRTVNVYLKGYHVAHEAALPTIKMNNQPLKADFFLRTDGTRKSYASFPAQTATQEGDMLMSTFRMPLTSLSNDMTIEVIRTSDAQTAATVDLKQYVEDNASRIDDVNEFGVLIYFALGGHVEVSVPGWSGGSLNPGW